MVGGPAWFGSGQLGFSCLTHITVYSTHVHMDEANNYMLHSMCCYDYSIISIATCRYYNLSRDVENEIEAKRQEYEKEPVKYQVWFQNNYPTMQTRLENAYMEWVVFGQKEIVEANKAKIDTSSIAAELQAAKVSLRSSGKIALDHTSTIYPVHFEPSNWYEYLRPRLATYMYIMGYSGIICAFFHQKATSYSRTDSNANW